jgi:5-methyltetrahydrofolate--homocysteine methyltransferase
VKDEMFRVLHAEEIGMGLTESWAMTPAASVSGFYFSHPEARYFNIGKIAPDQIADLASRSTQSEETIQRHLASHLVN